MTAPHITVIYDLESEAHVLHATSYGQTMPAGPRLFRAPPWPDIAFEHSTAEAASHDAALLQRYLDDAHARRGPSKAKLRAAGVG